MSDKRIRKNMAMLQQNSSTSLASTPASSLTPLFADMPSLTSLSTSTPATTNSNSNHQGGGGGNFTATSPLHNNNNNSAKPNGKKSSSKNNNNNNSNKQETTTLTTSPSNNKKNQNGNNNNSVSGSSTTAMKNKNDHEDDGTTAAAALPPSLIPSSSSPSQQQQQQLQQAEPMTHTNSSPSSSSLSGGIATSSAAVAVAPSTGTPTSTTKRTTKGVAKPKFSLGLMGDSTASSMSRAGSTATTNSQATPATATSTFGGGLQQTTQQANQQMASSKPLNNASISSINDMLRQDSFVNMSNNNNNEMLPSTTAPEENNNKEKKEENNNTLASATLPSATSVTPAVAPTATITEDAPPSTATATTPTVKTTTKLRKVGISKKPKLPGGMMSLGLDLDNNNNNSDGTGVVEVTKKSVTKTEMEHLIVDCETSLDSPFIATSGQFPGHAPPGHGNNNNNSPPSSSTGGGPSPFGLPIATTKRSATTGGTSTPPLASGGGGNLAMNTSKPKLSTSGGGGLSLGLPPSASSSSASSSSTASKRKFFRIDESNLFVFVDDPSAGKQSDLLPGSQNMSEFKISSGTNNNNNNNNSSHHHHSSQQSNTFTTSSTRGSNGGPIAGKGGIPFEKLVFGGVLGHGAQGIVHAVSYLGKNYALKKISVSDALDRGQAHVERQARKNGIVRELQMVANRDEACTYLVGLHNAYFRKDSSSASSPSSTLSNNNNNNPSMPHNASFSSDGSSLSSNNNNNNETPQQHLYILMERMSMSVEDLKNMAAKLPIDDVRKTAQRVFGDKISGTPPDGRKVERKQFLPKEYVITAQRHTPLPELVISIIAADILRGLAHLHNKLKLVHTDLKPANMMLSENLELVKIADFGCSQQLSDETGDVTVKNVVLGTKLYMSPERARASYGFDLECTFDEKADIFAFGISMLELAAGCHPCDHFREEYWNFSSMLKWNNLAKPESMAYDFVDFLKRCLDPDPINRASSEELLRHDFIRRFEKANRQKLGIFFKSLKAMANDFNIREVRSSLREHVTAAATLTADVKRNSVQTWKGFSKGIRGLVPDHTDEGKFPKLGE